MSGKRAIAENLLADHAFYSELRSRFENDFIILPKRFITALSIVSVFGLLAGVYAVFKGAAISHIESEAKKRTEEVVQVATKRASAAAGEEATKQAVAAAVLEATAVARREAKQVGKSEAGAVIGDYLADEGLEEAARALRRKVEQLQREVELAEQSLAEYSSLEPELRDLLEAQGQMSEARGNSAQALDLSLFVLAAAESAEKEGVASPDRFLGICREAPSVLTSLSWDQYSGGRDGLNSAVGLAVARYVSRQAEIKIKQLGEE